MSTSIVIATYGADNWANLALTRAYPSTEDQGAEVILEHLYDGTLAEARNAGAARATCDWLIFLDADDELEPGYVDAMWRAACTVDGHALLVPQVRWCYGKARPAPKFPKEVDLRMGSWLVIGTAMPRVVFEEIGGFKDWPLYEDFCIFQRAWKAGCQLVKVPDAIYTAYANPRSRNRAPGPRERVYWHQKIGHANYPELYDAVSAEEDQRRTLLDKGRPRRRLRLLALDGRTQP